MLLLLQGIVFNITGCRILFYFSCFLFSILGSFLVFLFIFLSSSSFFFFLSPRAKKFREVYIVVMSSLFPSTSGNVKLIHSKSAKLKAKMHQNTFREVHGVQDVPQHVREWINHWADICNPQEYILISSSF